MIWTTRVAEKHELKFKSASSDPRVMSSDQEVQIHKIQIQLSQLRDQIHELQV